MKRNPWVAALLSIALPGLGHVYVGEPRRGIVLWAALVVTALASFFILLQVDIAPLNMLVPLAVFLGMWLYVHVDAIIRARRTTEFSVRAYNRWWVYLGAILFMGFVGQPAIQTGLKSGVAEAFRIPTGAMAPTLQAGDYVLVNRRTYLQRRPERLDLVVFRLESAPETIYLKRVLGIPGDTLAMVQKVLYVNGEAVSEPYVLRTDPIDVSAPAMLWQRDYLVGQQPGSPYSPTRDNWGPLVVPEASYFVLGDNRDDSEDSRYYGFVAETNLLGAPERIYFSAGPQGNIRWSRIGEEVL